MTLTSYKFDAYPDEYILNIETSVNKLAISLWRWNAEEEDYETIYDKSLFGYCPNCGAMHVFVNVGFDYDVAAEIVSNLEIAECECED